MKTSKLFLSIALVALTAITSGRISEPITGEECCASDVVYEQAQDLENWMSVPFEYSMMESDLDLESWMSEPFEYSFMESDLVLENWMSEPFGTILVMTHLLS